MMDINDKGRSYVLEMAARSYCEGLTERFDQGYKRLLFLARAFN